MLLGLSGFVRPIESVVDGVLTLETQTQTSTVLLTIRGILAVSAFVLLIPTIIIAARWTLTKEKHAVLVGYLDRKRSGIELGMEEEKEIQEIMKPMI
jgi:Na+/melibiose symporter-like transporter